MSRPRRLVVVTACLALVGCAPAPPGALQGGHTDLCGDPLPPGALARIGTTRFRYGNTVTAVAFSPDGKTLAACGPDGIRLWDSATGKELRRTQGERLGFDALVFRPDGKGVIASRAQGKESGLWSWTWDAEPQRLPIPEGPNYSLMAISPDGRVAVAARAEKAASLLEAETGKEIAELAGARHAAAFSADGKTFATPAAEAGDLLILWDATTGKELRRVPDGAAGKGHGGRQRFRPLAADPPSRLALSPDGKLAAATYDDSRKKEVSVRFWDTASGEELRSVRGSGFSPRGLAFSPDGRVLALAAQSGLRLWEMATGKELWYRPAYHNPFYGIAFSPDGRTLAAGLSGLVRLWDVATGRELLPVPAHRDRIGFVRLSPDGRTVITAPGSASEDGPNDRATVLFRYWDARTGMELAPPSGQGQKFPSFESLGGDADLSADGKMFAAPGNDRAVHLWDVASGKELRKVALEGATCCRFSPDGKLLLLQSYDPSRPPDSAARGGLWEVETGKPLGELVTNSSLHLFSPDGKVLASWWSSDGSLRLLDVSTLRELRRLEPPGARGGAFTFAPDGRVLAWVYRERPEIRLWDVATGAQRPALAAGQPKGTRGWNVERLVFTPDGKWLVGGGIGGTVCFWDAATGALRQEVATGHSLLNVLTFSPDGRVLLTADHETGLVWDVPELLKGDHP